MAPDAKISFIKAPFIQYEQILLDKNFRQYLETIMVSEKVLRMGVQKTPIQKTYEIAVGSNSININFLGSNRQFHWLEISLVFDKSDKHTAIYDSYNAELAAKYIKSVKLTNFTEIYSLTNKKYDMGNLTQKHLLYNQFVAWTCNGCSTAPLTDYINNPVYQELIDEDEYDSEKSNERVYLDLRATKKSSHKKAKANNMGYSLGEYLNVLSRQDLTLRHKIYSISQEDDDFLE